MSRDELIAMAREAELPEAWISQSGVLKWADLERFAALVAAKEREACAQVCVEISVDYWMGDAQFEAATRCRNAIRARGSL